MKTKATTAMSTTTLAALRCQLNRWLKILLLLPRIISTSKPSKNGPRHQRRTPRKTSSPRKATTFKRIRRQPAPCSTRGLTIAQTPLMRDKRLSRCRLPSLYLEELQQLPLNWKTRRKLPRAFSTIMPSNLLRRPATTSSMVRRTTSPTGISISCLSPSLPSKHIGLLSPTRPPQKK